MVGCMFQACIVQSCVYVPWGLLTRMSLFSSWHMHQHDEVLAQCVGMHEAVYTMLNVLLFCVAAVRKRSVLRHRGWSLHAVQCWQVLDRRCGRDGGGVMHGCEVHVVLCLLEYMSTCKYTSICVFVCA
jgi:hypothetical protein